MSFANRLTGNNLWVGWIDGSGTAALTGDQTAFSPDIDQQTVDMSAGSDAMRSYRGSLKDFSATLELFNAGSAGTPEPGAMRSGSPWRTHNSSMSAPVHRRAKPRMASSSESASSGSTTLIVAIPISRAGLRFIPRSSRNTASDASTFNWASASA